MIVPKIILVISGFYKFLFASGVFVPNIFLIYASIFIIKDNTGISGVNSLISRRSERGINRTSSLFGDKLNQGTWGCT